jgi:tRNA 2-thiouridine synthesizing protein A
MELRRRIRDLPAGTIIHLIAWDPAASIDLPAWCHLTGHAYLFGAAFECGQMTASRPI